MFVNFQPLVLSFKLYTEFKIGAQRFIVRSKLLHRRLSVIAQCLSRYLNATAIMIKPANWCSVLEYVKLVW